MSSRGRLIESMVKAVHHKAVSLDPNALSYKEMTKEQKDLVRDLMEVALKTVRDYDSRKRRNAKIAQ